MVYIKNGKGFRSGGHNLRATVPLVAIPFKPEIAYSTEIGIKSEFFDNRVRFNAAAYRTRVNNLQRSTLFLVNGQPITFLGNAASSRITGMEADLTVAPIKGLTLVGTVALTDPEYIAYQEVPSRTNLTGDRACCEIFESVPEKTFSLQGSYEFPIGDRGELLLSANYNWVSEVKLVSGNFFVGNPFTVIVDPFTGMTVGDSTTNRGTADPIGLLGASIAYTFDDRYTIRAWGRNLTNESGITTSTNAQLGYVNAGLREPRTYGLTLSAEF
jgi:iron complex outermembrane receptor protein